AYGDGGITADTIAKAIATFERGIVSARAPFDAWVEGDAGAMPPDARRGFALFTGKARCSLCHTGWRFTDDGFHDVGTQTEDVGRIGHADRQSERASVRSW